MTADLRHDPLEPMDRIAVGIDFSDESLRAFDHAVRLAHRANAALVLVHATPLPRSARLDGHGSPRTSLDQHLLVQVDESRAELSRLADKARADGLAVDEQLVDNHAVPGVAATVNELGVGAIVLGSRGRTGLARFLLGSVAERTIRAVDCHALIARGAPPDDGYRRILVGTDFSDTAERALRVALDLAAAGAYVELFHCSLHESMTAAITPEHAAAVPLARAIEDLEQTAAAEGEALRRRYDTRRVDLAFEQRRALAPSGLLDRVDDSGPFDLVVVGSHGRRGWRRFVLGSVAEVTARHAPCSVAVVHAEGAYDE